MQQAIMQRSNQLPVGIKKLISVNEDCHCAT